MKLYELVIRETLQESVLNILSEIHTEEAQKKKVGRGVVISGDALIDIMKSKEMQLKVLRDHGRSMR